MHKGGATRRLRRKRMQLRSPGQRDLLITGAQAHRPGRRPGLHTPALQTPMRLFAIALVVLSLAHPVPVRAQDTGSLPTSRSPQREQDVLRLSRDKWRWMSERKVDSLAGLFHEEAVFVHMGGSMSRSQELETIRSGGIHYKHAEIQEASVRFIGTTAIVLNRIVLDAVVGGNEVTNPFVVTEVYVQLNNSWKLGSLSFTRLSR
jgi:hypothetical protein